MRYITMNNINCLKMENRDLVKDNLGQIMDNIYGYITDQYLRKYNTRIEIKPCDFDNMVKGTSVTKMMLIMNIDLIYSKLLDKGYICNLIDTENETGIILSV